MEKLKILQTIIYPLKTRVIWNDGTETEAEISGDDTFDEDKGVLYAIVKKFLPTSEILEAIRDGKDSVKRTFGTIK